MKFDFHTGLWRELRNPEGRHRMRRRRGSGDPRDAPAEAREPWYETARILRPASRPHARGARVHGHPAGRGLRHVPHGSGGVRAHRVRLPLGGRQLLDAPGVPRGAARQEAARAAHGCGGRGGRRARGEAAEVGNVAPRLVISDICAKKVTN
mgnify:CR=1 FL=1